MLAAKEKGSKSCAHPQHVVEAGGDADDSQSTRETAGGGQEGNMDGKKWTEASAEVHSIHSPAEGGVSG